jgi:D-glycero-beta-D-manno-heptose 1-phosphate adenylyltransferase
MSLTTIEDALKLRAGKKLVFTNGVFDILHAGHVLYLEKAKSLGNLLIVGVNTDGSVQRLGKGPGRPINALEDRVIVLSALRFVDAVVAFDEDTPEQLIAALKPEFHVKGGDYREADLPESKIVRAYGGVVVIMPTLEGRSTTNTLRKLEDE